MKKFDIGQLSQVLANIGVMVGLVFLAAEVSQNQATLEEQTRLNSLTGRDAAVENFNEFRTLLLENPDLMQIWNRGTADEELTDIEEERFSLLCENQLWARLTIHNRLQALGSEAELAGSIRALKFELADSERYRKCWGRTKRFMANQGHDEFIQAVDAD
jgi:hypothetical protein